MHSLLKPKSRKGEGRHPLGSPEAGTSLVTVEREDVKYSLSEGRNPLGSPGASTSLVTVERKEEKHSLHLVFPENKQLEVHFNNRASDDLPANIKGVGAVWHEEECTSERTYKIKVNNLWYNIEYINNKWYYIYWSTRRGQYTVIGSDLIKQPHYYGLGIKSLPYVTRENKPQESPEEESPQTTRRSEEDEPIATQEQQTKVGRLAYQFHDTSLKRSLLEETARLHGDQVAHQIYQRMATEATTITEQAQQPIQWTHQAAPLVQQQQQPPRQPARQQPPQ